MGVAAVSPASPVIKGIELTSVNTIRTLAMDCLTPAKSRILEPYGDGTASGGDSFASILKIRSGRS